MTLPAAVSLRSLWLPLMLLYAFPVQAGEHWLPKQAVVVSAQPAATQAGVAVLQAGGNAFDAAAAVALTLGVAEPGSSGIGGGGFFLFCLHGTAHCQMLDARETSPALAAHGELYRRQSSIDGAQSAAVPGLLAGIDYLLDRYGSLPRQRVTQAAIALARQGYRAGPRLQRLLKWRQQAFNPAARRIFLPEDGIIRQPALAATLERYSRYGVKDFYQGETARRLVADMQRDGGLIRAADLAAYRAIPRQPVNIQWQAYHIVSASLPSSGGMVLAEVLGMLQQDALASMPTLTRKQLLIEAMRRAYRDRNQYLGDRDFVTIPEDYLATARLKKLRQSIRLEKATASNTLHGLAEPAGNGRDTSHFSIIDQQGNMVVATLSINYPFGAAYVSSSTGIVLNDEMDDFATRPGKANAYGLVQGTANAVAPGKRMLSSMTPTIVFGQHQLFLLGTPGGSRIISMVLLAAMHMMNKDGEPASWVQTPRYHHQFLPDVVQYEQGAFTADELRILRQRGYRLKQVNDYGNMQAIACERSTQQCTGIADRRGEGVAMYVSGH